MKKQFSHKPSLSYSTGRNPAAGFLWAFGIVILITIIFIFLRIFVPGTLVAIASPFWAGGASLDAGVGSAFAGLGNGTKLAQENAALEVQLSAAQNENAVLTARAQDLTKLLGGQSEVATGADSNVLAGVLARPPESPYDTLIVNEGSADAVKIGAEVFATGGIPIGSVKSVTTHSSTIELLSTARLSTSGWIGDNRIPLTLTGAGAGAFTATLPKAAPISVGDSVYVPGPGAIPLGTIARIDTDPSSPTVVLYIQPLVNIFSLTWVEIARVSS